MHKEIYLYMYTYSKFPGGNNNTHTFSTPQVPSPCRAKTPSCEKSYRSRPVPLAPPHRRGANLSNHDTRSKPFPMAPGSCYEFRAINERKGNRRAAHTCAGTRIESVLCTQTTLNNVFFFRSVAQATGCVRSQSQECA